MQKLLFALVLLGVSAQAYGQRRVQNSLHFDGVNDIVRAQTKTSTNMKDSAITVEAWIKPAGFQPLADGGTIIARHDEPGKRGFTLACGDEGQLYFGIFGDTSYAEIKSPKNTLKVDSWSYVAATFDHYTLRLFVNGNMIDSFLDSTQIGDVPYVPLTVGNHHDLSRPFWGCIDEAKLWSRALSKSEIKDQFNFWYCGYNASLKAYFKFNRGTAAGSNSIYFKLPDWSGFGNEGTLTNFQLSGTTSNFLEGVNLNQIQMYKIDTVVACDRYRAPSRLVTWTSSGTYVDTVISYYGCDSALKIILTLNNSSYDTLNIRTCSSYTTPSGKQVLTKSGTYTDILKNHQNCDSVLTLHVKIGPDSTFKDTQNYCHEFVLPVTKKSYKVSGTYVDSLTDRFGCDSLVFYPVNIIPRSGSQKYLTFCDSVYLPSSKRWVKEGGTQIDTLKNHRGCDSLVIYTLNSLETRASFQDFACKQYVSPSKKYTWTTSGIYYDTLVNAKLCDSVIQVNLTIFSVTDTVLNIKACRSFRAPSRRYFITQSGTFYDTVMNSFGCDSLITINAEITNLVRDLVQAGDTLKSTETYDSYQWFKCGTGFQIIPNANMSYYIPKEAGNYAVRMVKDNCVDTSKCFAYTPNGSKFFSRAQVLVYPNPNSGSFYIEFTGAESLKISCFNLQGQRLETPHLESIDKNHYRVTMFHKGMIFLKLEDGDGHVHQTWVLLND